MVVLAASIISKSGKALVTRQFVSMSRIRIEGLLAAFPKLVGSGKQHTFAETENVRYVYHPMEALYLILVTSKQSNILEDLETLRLLSKLDGICDTAFDLVFAFDEVISLGHRENITVSQVKQYCEMESHEEKLHKLMMVSKVNETKDLMKRKASEIDKSKIDRSKSGKGGFVPLSSMGSSGMERTFSELNISSGYKSSSSPGFGITADMDNSYSSKPKGSPYLAAASPKAGGMQLTKNKRPNQFLESLKREGEEIVEHMRLSSTNSRTSAPPPTDPVTLTVEEKLSVVLKRDGGLFSFDVQGTLSLQILEEKDAYIQVQVESKSNPSILFKTHPNINKDMFANENCLGLKDPNRPFPINQSGDGVGLLKWRMQSMDESNVPFIISCWPNVSGNETDVSIEYEASSLFDLRNIIIEVPLSALRESPNVRHIDGEWRFDAKNSLLEWSIVLVDSSNRSGSIEFVVPATNPSAFFPITVQFTATDTFSGLKVLNILPQKGGPPSKFCQRTVLCAEKLPSSLIAKSSTINNENRSLEIVLPSPFHSRKVLEKYSFSCLCGSIC